jgi:MOSC domain-containing protein YiiM
VKGRIEKIRVGRIKSYGSQHQGQAQCRAWSSAIDKREVTGPVRLGRLGFEGDEQADRAHHGGLDKAVLCYTDVHIEYFRQRLGRPELCSGGFGENLTLSGLDEAGVCVGDVFALGDAVVQVTQPRRPCWKLGRRWGHRTLALDLERSGRTGFYLRVLREGSVAMGAWMELSERSYPQWPVERVNRCFHDRDCPADEIVELAQLDALPVSVRARLARRAQGEALDESARLFGEP